VRRSRRRNDYSSSSFTSSSSETEYRIRRRRRREKKQIYPLVYRVGDKLEFKKSGGRRRRQQWVSAEVYDVHRGGMYGELTYTVWLYDSRRMVDFVRSDELRFRYHHEVERRLREDEMARYREELRQINLKLVRHQRVREFSRGRRLDTYGGGRGQSQQVARARRHRAYSADGNFHISATPNRNQERATSVPPGNQFWPHFLAEFAKSLNGVPREDLGDSGDDHLFNELEHEAVIHERDIRHDHDIHVYKNAHDHLLREDYYGPTNDRMLYGDVNPENRIEFIRSAVQRTPPVNDRYTGDRLGANSMDVKDRNQTNGEGININFVLQPCRSQQVGDN